MFLSAVPDDSAQEMRLCARVALLLAFVLGAQSCGPGRGAGRRRGPRKLTPFVFKQHVPNIGEKALAASGLNEGKIGRNDSRFQDLVPNYNQDIIFKDEEGTGADRLMTQRCKEKVNTLAISVMNQWPGVHLVVTEGWDEEHLHDTNSLHYEGRAVDITTDDRDRSKLGMLARLAVEAGFDWVYYESRSHVHCSVKSESSQAAKYGGCFSADSTVLTSTGEKRKLSELQIGEKILSQDLSTKQLVFSEVILFLDYDPLQRREFLNVTLSSGRTLTVTPTHLVLTGTLRDSRTVFAETLKVGDNLLVSDSNNTLFEDAVLKVEPILQAGVFAPLTETGTLIVNDVLASCYAAVDSQRLAHWAFSPLRLVWNIKEGMSRLWTLISKPMMDWSDVPQAKLSRPSSGIHWYAKMLYATADYLVPSHMHK